MTGFRLARLELYNWGTFDGRVWALGTSGQNTLLTGDIGSGKSTIVDAVTTLLLPAQKISFNKAAGAEAKERSLRSYVLGYYKAERDELTGATRPVQLRDGTSYSVILGVFRNEGYDETRTLAQVFYLRDPGGSGQPDRFYLTADRVLSTAKDLAGFGTDITQLRKRLRSTAGVRVHDSFPEYGKDFRRRLGIESEQAMELFHQTVSMKSVGNLTDFVRDHMLEPFDAERAVSDIVAHFEDLTKAHEAVQRARAQLAALTPLLDACDKHDKLRSEIATLHAQRDALRYYFAALKTELTEAEMDRLSAERAGLAAQVSQLESRLESLRNRERALEMELAGKGGNRLAEIEQQLAGAEKLSEARMEKATRFSRQLEAAGLDQVQTAEHFAVRRRQIAAALAAATEEAADGQNKLTETAVELQRQDEAATEVNNELVSLRQHTNNIPRRNLDLRAWMCRELRLTEETLPFVGELIAVRDDQRDWEGAAERVLHSFALSILVPDQHYAAVSDWINAHHLGARVVYYRVTEPAGRQFTPDWGPNTLSAKLEIKDTRFASWLERELAHRADHECVATMAEFRRLPKAITRAGQIKDKGRHEKDDRKRIDDRSTYVLGWTNERKIEALLKRASEISVRLGQLRQRKADQEKARDAASERGQVLVRLDETRDFADIDWQSLVTSIEELKTERDRLKTASAELARLAAQLDEVRGEIGVAEAERTAVQKRLGGVENQIATAERVLADASAVLAEDGCAAAQVLFEPIAALLAKADHPRPAAASACDKAESAASTELSTQAERRAERMNRLARQIVIAMKEFRQQYPVQASELNDSVESADGYRELHKRLVTDDLPRFTEQFKTYLNQNTIRDIAGFQSQLNKQAELIKERIATINRSLADVEYNRGRYIRLEPIPSPHTEIRDFRADLRACTDDAVSGADSDQYSEQKFLQVSRIIERFRGREGMTDADRRWTRFVTDVRNWYTFAASERYREDDTEYEHYADSGGKSGGQKEKLAYTILAASLAYQFKLEWDGAQRSRTFRFAVIDEAFGRGSDESTRFALELFGKLGLQLLIVTPLQKIHVIEPYVSAVGFVDNRDGNYSRMETMTIEQYQARRLAHALARS